MSLIENRFNLVDEPWIPVAGHGLVSLSDIFSKPELPALGGNPIQKIALLKLLLAIAQSAYTPKDDEGWKQLGADGMADKCFQYLKDKRDLFWLYGEKPFLQMPAIVKAEKQSFGALQVYIATGNTTVLTESHIESNMFDFEKALLVLQVMSFSLGGKKTDNRVVLSPGYKGKTNEKGKASTGKAGPSIGFMGFLHSYLFGETLLETIWLNMLTQQNIEELKIFSEGVGIPPWEAMPQGEDCLVAKEIKNSYLGRLVPLSRFLLLNESGIHYSEGLLHDGYLQGMADVSVTVDFSKAKPKVIWVDPEKRPWRQLTSLLAFFENSSFKNFDCPQLRIGIQRIGKSIRDISIWAGGIRVSSNAGEQYVAGNNDFVESKVKLNVSALGDVWFANLKREMEGLENISKILHGAAIRFFKAQNSNGKQIAAHASNLFWQLCERKFQNLVDTCYSNKSDEELKKLREIFAGFVNKAYNTFCPKDTARQLDAWAANKPNLAKYLTETMEDKI